jgi:biotin carboxyl carrier protein
VAEKPGVPPAGEDVDSGAEAIARVAAEVLPTLIARIAASDLGELEVAQAGWRVRLRRDLGPVRANGAMASPGSGPHVGSHVGGSHGSGVTHGTGSHATAGTGSAQASATANRSSVVRRAAIAPAVGYFTQREGLATGQAVRSGDVLGTIDVLGVTQPVLAPTDGVVGRILASVGEAVEYGQELVRIDGIERLVES